MERIELNLEIIKQYSLSLNEAVVINLIDRNIDISDICMIPTNKDSEFKEKLISLLIEKFYVRKTGDKYVLRQKGKDFIEKSKTINTDIEDLDTFIKSYRELFKGKKVGSMGTLVVVKEKMKDFLAKNKYTKEEILKATENYIKSMNGNYTYLQDADYFISKIENGNSKFKKSRLSSFCEELGNVSEEYNNTQLI